MLTFQRNLSGETREFKEEMDKNIQVSILLLKTSGNKEPDQFPPSHSFKNCLKGTWLRSLSLWEMGFVTADKSNWALCQESESNHNIL